MKKIMDIIKIELKDLYSSQAEYQKIQAEFCGSIQQLSPGLYSLNQELFNRISTRNWALEWGLPRWLGETFNLPESTIHELILANIFLLGFVRITDDVIDDDFQPSYTHIEWLSTSNHQFSANDKKHNQAILLGTLLQNLWHRHQMRLLSQARAKVSSRQSCDNGISRYLDVATQSLSDWINATFDQGHLSIHSFSDFTEADYLRIGHKFSLLKICCMTACLLAGRDTEIQPLNIVVDHISIGVVMMDDILDWLNDLQTGRYNVFIAFCSDLTQTAEFQSANELAILRAIYVDQKLDLFFDLILEHISTAEKAAMAISPKFCKFISCLKSDICTYKSELSKITLAQMREASDRFLTKP